MSASGRPGWHLRIARPVTSLERSVGMYCLGLGLREIGRFEDHGGFDGVMLGAPELGWHIELTRARRHPVSPRPTPEDLIVLYVPDPAEWERLCGAMTEGGFSAVAPFNPYWQIRGRTFEDHDGYRVVLQNDTWYAEEARRTS